VVMPVMDGFEVCKKLKADPATQDIPVLFLTGLDSRADEAHGLSLGAADFIHKPVSRPVVLARVRNHLELSRSTRALRERNLDLERVVAERTRELVEANENLEKRIEERTSELQAANRELEDFSYSISHDLRAPLRAINAYSQMLLDDCSPALEEEYRQMLRRILTSTVRMGSMIDELLQLARIPRATLELQSVDLTQLADDIVRTLRDAEPDRSVDVAVEPGLRGYGDPTQLRLVLENLLGNAWKYTGRAAAPRIGFYARDEGAGKRYFVEDNGAGFDMAFAGQLFQPFHRLHGQNEFPGTGIGLATVHRILRRHGAEIGVEAAPGSGAKFWFTLPTPGAHEPSGS